MTGLDVRSVTMARPLSPAAVRLLLSGIVVWTVGSVAPRAADAPSLLFHTSFESCPDWNQTMGLGDQAVCDNGDGLSGYGAWTTSSGKSDEIVTDANNPGGGGGRGFRHWRNDGQNNNGGGLKVVLPSPVTEAWIRWYMRYEKGFAWKGGQPYYTKDLYFDLGGAPQQAVGWKGNDDFGTTTVYPSRNIAGPPGWISTMKGSTGDGVWHAYEIHMKTDTNGRNGVFESWIDGTRTTVAHDVDWGGQSFRYFVAGENQNSPANGGDRYTDYDDFAVSTAGYIGPLPNAVAAGATTSLPSAR